MATAGRFRTGIACALGAYLIWGFLPLFFRLIGNVGPVEIVAQRILWSLLFLALIVLVARRGPALLAALRNPAAVRLLLLSALLIGVNWLIYVWAVLNGHVLASSLGYFLNPLLNVALGVVLLKERLSRVQTMAVALAAIGVAVLAAGALTSLWISLSLALSFALYGLIRKVVPVESLEGLAVETILLAPLALGYVLWLAAAGQMQFGTEPVITSLLALAGVATAVPLLLFAAGARLLQYATMGLLQYIAPSIQFALAITVFEEPLTRPQLICFVLIWTGLALYAGSSIVAGRRAARPLPA